MSMPNLLIVDIQEKLFPHIFNHEEILITTKKAVQVFQKLGSEVYVTEQYPKGLGKTIPEISKLIVDFSPIEKTKFSAASSLVNTNKEWVIIGIEAHICIFQTVKEFLKANQKVSVIADAIGSRYNVHYDLALGEMRAIGARITSLETFVFELLKDSEHKDFKEICKVFR